MEQLRANSSTNYLDADLQRPELQDADRRQPEQAAVGVVVGSPFSRLAYGEVGNPGHTGPMFNPLHPTVQEAIIGLVREIGQRDGKYPAFQGVSFNLFASAMPWFGSIHFGYDDYSVGLFQQETGTDVPIDAKRRTGCATLRVRPAPAGRRGWPGAAGRSGGTLRTHPAGLSRGTPDLA